MHPSTAIFGAEYLHSHVGRVSRLGAEAEEEMAVAGVAGIAGACSSAVPSPAWEEATEVVATAAGSRWQRLVAIAIDNAHDRPPVDLVKAGELDKDAEAGLLGGPTYPCMPVSVWITKKGSPKLMRRARRKRCCRRSHSALMSALVGRMAVTPARACGWGGR